MSTPYTPSGAGLPPRVNGDQFHSPQSPSSPLPAVITPPVYTQYTQPRIQPNLPQHGKKSSNWKTVLVVLTVLAFAGIAAYSVYNLQTAEQKIEQLEYENNILDNEKSLLDEKNKELEERVNAKDQFASVAQEFYDELHAFDGTPYKELFNQSVYANIIQEAYDYRDNPEIVATRTAEMRAFLNDLKQLKTTMANERATNKSGDVSESILDELSQGYSTSSYYSSPSNPCKALVSACVWTNNPETVHFNTDSFNEVVQYRGDEFAEWWKKGVAYHEFAHVLQSVNVETTNAYLPQFRNDQELMADCYAAVFYGGDEFLRYSYNYGCTSAEKTAIREWVDDLTFEVEPVTQQ